MATFRKIHTEYWQDGFVLDLTPEEKYFYLYIMTNSKTTQCGIYELPLRVIEMETGYNRDTVEKLLSRFEEYGKIKYNKGTKELMIVNWLRYNVPNNKNIIKCVIGELKSVKSNEYIEILCSIAKDLVNDDELSLEQYTQIFKGLIRGLQGVTQDLPSKEEKEEEKEEKEEVEEIIHSETEAPGPDEPKGATPKTNKAHNDTKNIQQNIIDTYNSKCPSLPKATKLSQKRKSLINARLREYSIEQIHQVFDMAEASDFLSGRNGAWGSCNFDWIMNAENFLKIIEGSYKNKPKNAQSNNQQLSKNKFKNFEQRTDYDYDDIERKLLQNRGD